MVAELGPARPTSLVFRCWKSWQKTFQDVHCRDEPRTAACPAAGTRSSEGHNGDGDGADEAFAGYSHYPGWKEYKNTSEEYLYKNNFVKKWYPLANLIRPKKYPKINKPCNVLDNYLPWRQRMVNAKREKLWKSKYRYILNLPNELVYNYQKSFAKNGEFSGSQYFDIKTFLVGLA